MVSSNMVFIQINSNKSDISPHEREKAKNSRAQGTPTILEYNNSYASLYYIVEVVITYL